MATLPLLKAEDGRRPWCPQRGQLGDGGRRVWKFIQGGVACLPAPAGGLACLSLFLRPRAWPSKKLPGSCLGWKAAGPFCSRRQS